MAHLSTLPNRLKRFVQACATIGVAAASILLTAGQTQNAVANGDTRTLDLYYTHTREKIQVTFKRDGRYDAEGLKKLNWFLRDWRLNEPTRMDPRLFDIVWEVYREVRATNTIVVVSGYRSLKTNNMLRSRSRGVAKHSQHTQGRAMDFYIPGVNIARLREAGLRLQRGGVGFYPTANSPFVHMDAGSVRHWPKMTRQQLAKVFPDGRTVHIPTDGKPMANYALALADVQRNGGTLSARYAADSATQTASNRKSRGFLSRIFGDDEEEDMIASSGQTDERYAMLAPRRRQQDQLRAGAAPTNAAPVNTTSVAPIPLPIEAPPQAQTPQAPPSEAAPVTPSVSAPAPLPVPPARPAEIAPEPPAMVSAPALPVPRMAWTTGAQPLNAATPSEAAETSPIATAEATLPAIPLPRPSNITLPSSLIASASPTGELGSGVTAFAAEPQISLPMLRPTGLENHVQASETLQTAQTPSRNRKPVPVVSSAQSPRDHISRAYAVSAISLGSLPGDLMPIRLDSHTVRYVMSADRAMNNARQGMRHPNQNNLKDLMQPPVAALRTGFSNNPMNGLSVHRFQGGAVALLLSHSFMTADHMEATASISTRRTTIRN